MHLFWESVQSHIKIFWVFSPFNEKVLLRNRISIVKSRKRQILHVSAQCFMIYQNFLVHSIRQEHFFVQYFRNAYHLFGRDHSHPFFQRLPLPKRNKEIITANLIKSLHFLKPFLYRNKLDRLGIDKLANSLTAEGIVIFNLFLNNGRIGHHLHIVMIVLVFTDHIDEFIGCEFFLPDHLEECRHLSVVHWVIGLFCILFWDCWRNWLQLGFFCWRFAGWSRQVWDLLLAFLLACEGIATASSPCRNHTRIVIFLQASLFCWNNFRKYA